MQLTQEQEKELGLYLEDFRKSSIVEDNNVKMLFSDFDNKRMTAILDLKKMVNDFLAGGISLVDFKERSEAMSRTHPYWGFKGFSGQMQLNQYVNNIDDEAKEVRLKDALKLPKTLDETVSKIDTLAAHFLKTKGVLKNVTTRGSLSTFFGINSKSRIKKLKPK